MNCLLRERKREREILDGEKDLSYGVHIMESKPDLLNTASQCPSNEEFIYIVN